MNVEQLSLANYNKISNIPVINQDLSASGFTPVANTYYRHTETTDTYTQGVIYYYDGTEYKALDGSGGGSGGISDVKVNGTSVVTDGVANIPPASSTANGVVTTSTQTFFGEKTFNPTGRAGSAGVVFTANGNYTYIQPVSSSTAYYVFLGTPNYKFQVLHCNNGVFYQSVKTNVISRQDASFNIDVPSVQGTMMVAPSTWSSGTSGSVTLSESGTYQIKSNLGEAIVVYDGTRYVQSAIIYADSSNLYYYHISAEGVITVSYVGKNDSTSGSSTNYEIKYRKIGIA